MKFEEIRENYLDAKSHLEEAQEEFQQAKIDRGISVEKLGFDTYLYKTGQLSEKLNLDHLESKLQIAETELIDRFIELAKQPEHLRQLPGVCYQDLEELEEMTHIQAVADKLIELSLMLDRVE